MVVFTIAPFCIPVEWESRMRVILDPIPGIQKLIGSAQYDDGARYVRSRYCIETACEDGSLLYSTLTGELILLEEQDSPEEYVRKLVEKRFLVPSDHDEHAQAQQIKQLLSYLQPPSPAKTSFTIFTTTACNARCSYCYENGITPKAMSEQVAGDVADYIADHCKGEEVSIHWFGGEPLFNARAIDTISSRLSERGVSFKSHMTSNGFYLDREVARRAKVDWHLRDVQIAVDGTEDTYNRVKAYVDADGSAYQRVLENIGYALDQGIRVTVRLNMDEANADDLMMLADELAERFSGRRGLYAVAMPLVSLAGGVSEFDSDEEKVRRYKALYDRLNGHGLVRQEGLPRVLSMNRCSADNAGAEVILPDGQVARCEHFDETERIGDIYHPERDAGIVASWAKRAESMPLCKTCPHWPQCIPLERCAWDAGGCSEARREMRLHKFRNRMLAEYERSKGAMK